LRFAENSQTTSLKPKWRCALQNILYAFEDRHFRLLQNKRPLKVANIYARISIAGCLGYQ